MLLSFRVQLVTYLLLHRSKRGVVGIYMGQEIDGAPEVRKSIGLFL